MLSFKSCIDEAEGRFTCRKGLFIRRSIVWNNQVCSQAGGPVMPGVGAAYIN